MRLNAAVLVLLTAAVLAQTAPPLVSAEPEAEDAPPAVEAPTRDEAPAAAVAEKAEVVSDREDVMTKSAWRLHVSAGAGAFNGGSGGPYQPGMWVAIGKPLYVGDRHRRHQWFLDSSLFVGWSPGVGAVQLVITPTVGTTWYFGDFFGLEWRAGVGFGATPSPRNTGVGLGVSLEGALVFRPFADDRQRLKLQAREVAAANLLAATGMGTLASFGVAVAWEMPL